MKLIYTPLAASAGLLLLAACNNPTPPGYDAVPGDSAGSAGPGYCESVPADPDEIEQWNQLCSPDR
jgi:hypothetical protein